MWDSRADWQSTAAIKRTGPQCCSICSARTLGRTAAVSKRVRCYAHIPDGMLNAVCHAYQLVQPAKVSS